ncbi:hypothetical protein AS593_00915, partial [Caulobacter vibrioides]
MILILSLSKDEDHAPSMSPLPSLGLAQHLAQGRGQDLPGLAGLGVEAGADVAGQGRRIAARLVRLALLADMASAMSGRSGITATTPPPGARSVKPPRCSVSRWRRVVSIGRARSAGGVEPRGPRADPDRRDAGQHGGALAQRQTLGAGVEEGLD